MNVFYVITIFFQIRKKIVKITNIFLKYLQKFKFMNIFLKLENSFKVANILMKLINVFLNQLTFFVLTNIFKNSRTLCLRFLCWKHEHFFGVMNIFELETKLNDWNVFVIHGFFCEHCFKIFINIYASASIFSKSWTLVWICEQFFFQYWEPFWSSRTFFGLVNIFLI